MKVHESYQNKQTKNKRWSILYKYSFHPSAVQINRLSKFGHTLLGTWMLVSMVTVATYTGKLTSNSVIIEPELPFDNIDQLVQRSDYTWGTNPGSYYLSLLKVNVIYGYLYRGNQANPAHPPKSVQYHF